MSIQLSIICENTVGRPLPVCGEHGFSCLVEGPFGCWLFDTGSGSTLLQNLASLGHDAHRIEAIILSHGHYDHCGGLLPLLEEIGPRPVYAHSQVFSKRFWQGLHETRDISLPFERTEIEAAGADFVFCDTLTELAPGLHFSGAIERTNPLETGDPHLVRKTEKSQSWQPDTFPDDAALAIDTPKGRVVLLGCAHAGLINTMEHFRTHLGVDSVHAILGGTHLGPADDTQFDATVDYLRRLSFDRLGVSHCTGQVRAAQLYAQFPNKVFYANVGALLKVD